MFNGIISDAMTARLETYCQTNEVHLDHGKERGFDPINEKFVRGYLTPSPPVRLVNKKQRAFDLRGLYAADCFVPYTNGPDGALDFADAISNHFYPTENTPQTITTTSDEIILRLEDAPTVQAAKSGDPEWHMAKVLIPYLVHR